MGGGRGEMMNNSWRDILIHRDPVEEKRNPGSLCVLFLCYSLFCVSNSHCALPPARCQINDAEARATRSQCGVIIQYII